LQRLLASVVLDYDDRSRTLTAIAPTEGIVKAIREQLAAVQNSLGLTLIVMVQSV